MLPGCTVAVLLTLVVFCWADHHMGDSDHDHHDDHEHCPGTCVESKDCSDSVNDTDCEDGLVCCLDHFEDIATTEFSDDHTTEAPEDNVHEDHAHAGHEEGDEEAQTDEEQQYQVVYSDGTDNAMYYGDGYDASAECPGSCVSAQSNIECDINIFSASCAPDEICCVNQEDSAQEQQYTYVQDSSTAKRSVPVAQIQECPYSCIRSALIQKTCEAIAPDYYCPHDSQCCLTSAAAQSINVEQAVVECTGQCLPANAQEYCVPPYELIVGPTNCPHGSVCCNVPDYFASQSANQAQSMNRSPAQATESPALAHLMVLEDGSVQQILPSGITKPLLQLPEEDYFASDYTKVMTYPHPDGDIDIYSDASGVLYQQFNRNLQESAEQPEDTVEHAESEEVQEVEASAPESPNAELIGDVVIPDNEDPPPQMAPKGHGVLPDRMSTTTQCPGTCMSYFLRFTCFRGHAIYDGFTCSGKMVCCANLKDIEDHETYLKTLSPYFNGSPDFRSAHMPTCGIKGRSDSPHKVGVSLAWPGEWCWQVAIINAQNQYMCGGALIDNSWVLTAAHCVSGMIKENQAIFVRVGVTDLKSSEDNARGQTTRVGATYIHHNFNSFNLDNNIALLRLQSPLQLNPSVCVICLPTSGHMPEEMTTCTVTGYGFTSIHGDMPLKLSQADVEMVDDMECMSNITDALASAFIIPSSSFCARAQSTEEACLGDAGVPLVCEVDGFHELIGLSSWSLSCSKDNLPSVYVKIPSFMGWINQIISSSIYMMSLH